MTVDRDQLLAGVEQLAQMLGDVDGLRGANEAAYDSKQAAIDLLKQDRRVIEVDGGLLQYQLTKPITVDGLAIDALTFNKPTIGHIRGANNRHGDEWAAYMIKALCREIPGDEALNMIDASEWDAIVEVVSFPFDHPPCRRGGANQPASQTPSGEAS